MVKDGYTLCGFGVSHESWLTAYINTAWQGNRLRRITSGHYDPCYYGEVCIDQT